MSLACVCVQVDNCLHDNRTHCFGEKKSVFSTLHHRPTTTTETRKSSGEEMRREKQQNSENFLSGRVGKNSKTTFNLNGLGTRNGVKSGTRVFVVLKSTFNYFSTMKIVFCGLFLFFLLCLQLFTQVRKANPFICSSTFLTAAYGTKLMAKAPQNIV